MASNGGAYGIAWGNAGSGGEVLWISVDAAGSVVGTPIAISTSGNTAGAPDLIARQSGYAIAWPDGRDGDREIYVSELDETGKKLGEFRVLTTLRRRLSQRSSDRPSATAWPGSTIPRKRPARFASRPCAPSRAPCGRWLDVGTFGLVQLRKRGQLVASTTWKFVMRPPKQVMLNPVWNAQAPSIP